MRTYFLGTLAVAVSIATPSWSQDVTPTEPPSWIKSLGSFMRGGLAPPRTVADLAREEEERQMKDAAPPVPTPTPVMEAKPAPAPPPPVVEPAPPPPPQPVPTATEAPRPAPAAPAATTIPATLPVPKPRPQMVVPVIQPPPAPVAAIDRIAGTASLDQALKLGGSKELYGQRVRKPDTE